MNIAIPRFPLTRDSCVPHLICDDFGKLLVGLSLEGQARIKNENLHYRTYFDFMPR